jgi:succinoglycan biosynthesis transport protein ExoP
MQEKHKSAPSSGLNLTLADVYHMLFRQKWIIIAVWTVGIIAAIALHFVWPVPYTSFAKLYVRYVQDIKPINVAGAPGGPSEISVTANDASSVINTEIELLTSGEVALGAAETLDPETLAKLNAGTNKYVIAAVIQGGLEAEPAGTRNPVIHVSFKSKNPDVVQPVLTQIIESYKKQYIIMHHLDQDLPLGMQRDELKSKLTQNEDELRKLKEEIGVTSLEETKKLNEQTLRRIQEDIWSREIQLEEKLAVLHELTNTEVVAVQTNTSAPQPVIAAGTRAKYNEVCDNLDDLQKRKRDLLMTFTPQSSRIKPVLDQIETNEVIKAQLESEFPQIAMFREKKAVNSIGDKTANPAADLRGLNLSILALQTQIAGWTNKEADIREQMKTISEKEEKISQLQGMRDMRAEQLTTIERRLFNSALDSEGKTSGIHVSPPSIPMRDPGKANKIIMMVFFGAIAAGLALAFVVEFYLDRSFKRPVEIEPKLGLPLFLSIPKLQRNGMKHLSFRKVRLLGNGDGSKNDGDRSAEVSAGMTTPLAQWKTDAALQPFIEALRDRLITHFEINEINHKPKLVAVTSCAEGSGASTIASGLASSLSETGEGNVLLVDMNIEDGSAHFFHKGQLKCGLDEVLEDRKKRDTAQVEEHLFVVSEKTTDEKLPRILHRRFSALLPKLHASDFDYIIFDMPAISQTSSTTRVARFMDMVFMVVEAEKTESDVVKRASNMLAEAKATNVGVVLNKTRSYVPRKLSQAL